MGRTREKLRRRRRQQRQEQIMRILIPAVIILIIIYIIGAIFSVKHFCGRDTVFGIRIARQTTEKLKDKVIDKVSDYQITIHTREGEEVIRAEEIGLHFSDNGMIEDLKEEQRVIFWFVDLFGKSEDIPITMAYDEEQMEEVLDSLHCLNEEDMIAPVDSHLSYVTDEFEIIKEVMGTTVDAEATAQLIRDAILNGQEVLDLDAEGCYSDPVIYEDSRELEHMRREVNALIDVTIVYDFADRSETVDSAKISEWIVFGDDFTYELSMEKVEEYMKELGKTYDTFGLPHKFLTSNGHNVVLDYGDYGWCIHKTRSAEALVEMIRAGKSVTTEPIYLYEGKDRRVNDIGDTYIEVSIAQQRMWCYVDGVCIVDTPVVTGTKGVEDRETPRDGVWAIDAKMTDYNLVGEDYDSHVDYWLPFNGNVGVHDADWREEFGGVIYHTNGSHGCVNTPYSAAKKIYENVSIGTPVIVY